jgi:hypothetical protein
MPPPVYQNMVNLTMSLPTMRYPSKFRNVTLWERCDTSDNQTSDYGNFTTLTPLSLLISCNLSFPIVGLQISSLPTNLALNSAKELSFGI